MLLTESGLRGLYNISSLVKDNLRVPGGGGVEDGRDSVFELALDLDLLLDLLFVEERLIDLGIFQDGFQLDVLCSGSLEAPGKTI